MTIEIISQKPTEQSGEVTPVGVTSADPSETLASFHKVEKLVDDKLEELTDGFQALMQRFEDELLPLVDRAQSYLSIHGSMHVSGIGLPSWPEWRDAFLKKLKMKMSVRTLQRKLKQFRDELDEPKGEGDTDDDADDTDAMDTPAKPIVSEPPTQLLTKRLKEIHKVLSDGTAPVDADPLREEERRVSRALELIESTQLAIDEGLFETSSEPVVPERHSITPSLTHYASPPPAGALDKHEHAALYHAARVAALTVANAVEAEHIEARFYPVLIFLTDRKTVTFGRFLETQEIKKGGPYGEKWRGRTCFNLPGGEPYRTYEEAWAYVQAFTKALPDLDICYGVDMLCMDEVYGGRIEARKRRITQCNAPEPSHGG